MLPLWNIGVFRDWETFSCFLKKLSLSAKKMLLGILVDCWQALSRLELSLTRVAMD
jgi:hypothetical protein